MRFPLSLRAAAILPTALLAWLCRPSPAPAQSAPAAPAPPAALAAPEPIRPTTTVATGDRGGKFFGKIPDPKKSRHYYLAAESELWDYAPSGKDEVCGLPLPPPVLAQRVVGKIRYHAYIDATFGARAFENPALGILGPVLRGGVGEFLVVTFHNRSSQALSLHPHGVRYDKDSEGAYYQPAPGIGAAVAPGATFTYVWLLDEASGPLPTEPSSRAWLYHSHVTGDQETNLGLVGAIIVTDPQRARPDGTPADIDRELATLLMIFNESGLDDAAIEAAEYAGLPGAAPSAATPMKWPEIQQALAQGSRYTINGRLFGNLPALEANEGERTRWYLFALGSEQDFHTAHWHGHRVVEEGRRRTDVVELLPATMKVADLVADNPGTWLFHCHVAEHMREGMFTRLVVHARDTLGADRSPAHTFLGQPAALQSVRLTHADVSFELAVAPTSAAQTPLPPRKTETATLHLEGTTTVFESFALFNQALRIQLGDTSVTFRPNAAGDATAPGGKLRVKNPTEFGVVNGGLLEFELVLTGPEWLAELKKFGADASLRPKNTAQSPRVLPTVFSSILVALTISSRSNSPSAPPFLNRTHAEEEVVAKRRTVWRRRWCEQ